MTRSDALAVLGSLAVAVPAGWAIGSNHDPCELSCPPDPAACARVVASACRPGFAWPAALVVGGCVFAVLALLAVTAVRVLSNGGES